MAGCRRDLRDRRSHELFDLRMRRRRYRRALRPARGDRWHHRGCQSFEAPTSGCESRVERARLTAPRSYRALVLDDKPAWQYIFRESLERAGIAVDVSESPAEFREYLGRSLYH